MYLEKIKKMIKAEHIPDLTSHYKIKDINAALHVIDYVLNDDREKKDYFDHADEAGATPDSWYCNQVYAHALKAVGLKPDPKGFDDGEL